ncbi:MAG TPA: Coagulation factor 5/8 type domain-containing protein, partial [Marmoricola sp.]|nr:Coagulation factor 5/8 type domain-containing protein [Marmoricola sp.]
MSRTGTILIALMISLAMISPAQAVSRNSNPVNPPTPPEAEVNVTGTPSSTPWPDGSIRGFIDAHTHLMSNVGFGGSIVCGATFDPVNGAAGALKDCPSHGADGSSALIENVTRINVPFNPFAKHDVSGWPAMKDWPAYNSLTHQQMYYKWVERAWRSGQRIMVDDTVNNN